MQEALKITERIYTILIKINIDRIKHQKLFKLIDELNYNIRNNQSSTTYNLLNKILTYICYNDELIIYKELVLECSKILDLINRSFSLNKEESLLKIALQELFNENISLQEYKQILLEKENQKFDGNLTNEEKNLLHISGFNEDEILLINNYLNRYKDSLSGYKDLVGDSLVPDKKMFLFLIKHLGYLMSNNPDEVISKQGILIRRMLNPLIKAVGKNFLKNGQYIENREILIRNFDNNISFREEDRKLQDKGIILPKEPVIWVVNHGFKDDTLATILACLRHSYILFGNCAQFYNTFDGILSHLNGIFQCNRKSQMSKKASVDKALKTLSLGADLVVFPEAIWNKSPNKLVLELWSGFYTIAKESRYKIVPMVHYIKDANKIDNPIHTVIDDPIDISHLTEKEAKEYLTEIFATWQIIMMNSYGKTTRTEELKGFNNPHKAWENHLKNLVKQVDRFDSEAEHYADFRSLYRESLRPENIWQAIVNIVPKSEQSENEICQLVKTLKLEDYQRRI